MKTTTHFASIIATALLATAPAFAGQWDGNPEVHQSIINELDLPQYVGTGMSADQPRFDIYNGAFHGPDIDARGFTVGSAAPELGHGDKYGWAVLDVSGWPIR